MDTSSASSPPPAMLYFDDVLSDLRHWLQRACDRTEATVRDHPRKSLLTAFLIGAVTRRLPVPELLAAGLRTAIVAAPPALAVLGTCALVEHCRATCGDDHHAARPPRFGGRPDDFPLEGDGHTVIPGTGPSPISPAAGIL